jgi:radical SAM superfamily enzyme
MFGLPGESRDDILAEAELLNTLPVASLKIHQLQILSGTRMAREWEEKKEDFLAFTLDTYAQLVADFAQRLRSDIRIERFASSAPRDMLISPRFGVKQSVVEARIRELMDKS